MSEIGAIAAEQLLTAPEIHLYTTRFQTVQVQVGIRTGEMRLAEPALVRQR